MKMDISIVIPTYNAEKYLPALLKALKGQTISFELLIIDSSSTDDTIAISRQYTDRIIVIPKSEFDHGGTRTKAAQAASGEVVVFLTQDALPYDTETVETLVKVFDDPSVAAVYGRQIPYEKSSLFGKHLRHFNYRDTSCLRTLHDRKTYGIKTAFLSDSFAAYRKTALAQIDWFKNGLIGSEDTYAGAKLLMSGNTLAYCAEAKVYHSHSYTVLEEFKRYFDIGAFHQSEHWILDTFGKADGEGKKYVISEFNYILAEHGYRYIPSFFIRNGMKYLGYKLGYHHQKLPLFLIRSFSMHKSWWKR